MASLVTLASAPYNPYNTSLAEIALKGMEMGQAEMGQRDRLAQQGIENSMKASMMAADAVQKNAENNFKQREQARLDQQLVWGHEIDKERMSLSRDQLEESAREFDATLPLKERQLDIESGRLDIAQAAESRASEEWDLAGRPAAQAQLGLREQMLKVRELGAQNDAQRAGLMLHEAKLETDKARSSSVDFGAYSTDLNDQMRWVDGVSGSALDMLRLAEPKAVDNGLGPEMAALQQRFGQQNRSISDSNTARVVTQADASRAADSAQSQEQAPGLKSLSQAERDTLKSVFFLAQQAKAAGLEFGNVNTIMRANRGAPSDDVRNDWIVKYDNWTKALSAFRERAAGINVISGVNASSDPKATSNSIFDLNIDPRTGQKISP